MLVFSKVSVALFLVLLALPSYSATSDLEIGEPDIRNFEPSEYGGHPPCVSS